MGAVSALALPPVYAVPLLVPAFVTFAWLLAGTTRLRAAFWVGWAFGLGQFAAGLYWVGIAFFVDAARYGWMMPFAVFGLSAGLAIFVGLVGIAARAIPVWQTGRGALARVLVMAVAWCVAEWLRGHILTGFPWNLMGTVWGSAPSMQQSAALYGIWGLSFTTVLAATLPAVLGWARARTAWAATGSAILLVALLWGGGAWRLSVAPEPGTQVVDDVYLRLVQAGIPQHLKWKDGLRIEHVRKHLRLSRRDGFASRTHVIWPETAVPFLVAPGDDLAVQLSRAVPQGGTLLTGAPRASEGPDGTRRFHNSLIVLDGAGRELSVYDKSHLVPFGEYVPLRDYNPFPRLVAGRSDFVAGPGPQTLQVPGAPSVSPLICYEAIFPQEVVESGNRPGWLLNVTNDAWFGYSSGPYQHLASARLRAVERGLPLVRAANTGISVIVDPWGRVLDRLPLGAVGVLDGPLPKALSPSLYARFGDWVFAGLLLIGLLLAIALRRR